MPPMTIQQAFEMAVAHHQSGRLQQAEGIYRQILARQPSHVDALHLLGVIELQSGRSQQAIELMRRAITLNPGYAAAHGNLGSALKAAGQLDDAVAEFRRAIALDPNLPDAHSNLGNALREIGVIDEAIAACRRAIALRPDFPDAHCNLGIALKDSGQFDEAILAFRRASALRPNYPDALINLGAALKNKGHLDDAIAAYRKAIALKPNSPEVHYNLGNALKDMGLLDEAITAYRQALSLDPGNTRIHSNLVYLLHFHPAYDAQLLAAEHHAWNERHAEPLPRIAHLHANERSPVRRLRIGYVSPDFRYHPVGRFILPLLAHHDRQQFEVFAYAQVAKADALTQELRGHTDHWRSLTGLSDEQAAQLIVSDQIDILVDLAMHMADHRLLVFARKPAPVQVTYLAYVSTTGLSAIDYRLSDPHLDPPDRDASVYSEKTVLLPQTYWCYEPVSSPAIGPLPALGSGRITFGSLNNFCKVTEPALAAWARLLQAVPNSELLLHALEGSHRGRTAELLQRLGVGPGRLRFAGHLPIADYLKLYQQIDIALDPFPYGGGTTTCDALWMGVPVVSLAGETAVSRGGLSILSNLGLAELVAATPEQYVRIAAGLAVDFPRLAHLRSTLRQRMQHSPLMDAPRFAQNVEAAYRDMWRTFCAAPNP